MEKKLYLLVFILFLTAEMYPQWVRTDSPSFGYCFAISGIHVFAGTDEGVFLSSDYGTRWTAANSDLAEPVFSLVVNGTNLFAGTNTGVFLSTNNGANWTRVNVGLPSKFCVYAFAVIGINLFAGGIDGLFLSTNNGKSWNEVDSGLTDKYINCLAVIGTNLFAGTMSGGVLLSTNNGTNWTEVNTGLSSNEIVYTLAVIGTNLFAGSGNGVFLSTNSGTSWNKVDSGLVEKYVVSLAVSGTNLFAKTTGGVFLSTNSGISWIAVNEGLISTGGPGTLEVSGANLLLGTSFTGIWRRALAEMITSVEEFSNESPKCFCLNQNYPNPFNPSTSIQYTVGSRQFVTLKIYDILGREIVILVNEEKPAGTYKVTWNAVNIPSGVYFYQLKATSVSGQAGSFTATKKLLLLK